MRGSTILVVDDTEMARVALSRLLNQFGYETMCAANGLEALDILKTLLPDLVVLDVAMPELGGLGLLEILHGDARWQHLPVVMLSGETDSPTVCRARELGACEYMVKSASSTTEMLRVVERYTQSRDFAVDALPISQA